jgi:hypothetical protein
MDESRSGYDDVALDIDALLNHTADPETLTALVAEVARGDGLGVPTAQPNFGALLLVWDEDKSNGSNCRNRLAQNRPGLSHASQSR